MDKSNEEQRKLKSRYENQNSSIANKKALIIILDGSEEKVANKVKHQKEERKKLLIFLNLIVEVLHYFPRGNV